MIKKFIPISILILLGGLSLWGIRKTCKEPFAKKYHSSMAIYASNGELLRLTLSNDQKYRLWLPLRRISPSIIRSFIQSEDKYFYNHPGFNPVSLGRAIWTTYVAGQRRSGASTISMQLARMIYGLDSKKPLGKLLQIFNAVKIEFLYSKEEILEAYLNLVPMGGNIEGVGAASQIFFRKPIRSLGWSEAMLLAVIPQNPNKRTLLKGVNEQVKAARLRLASRMNEKRIIVDPKVFHIKDLPFSAPHFSNEVMNRSSGQSDVTTTLDLELQKKIEARVEKYLASRSKLGVNNSAVILMNWQTSEVVSWIGSGNFFDSKINGQVDGVTSMRSPGSTLKPFIYALAMEEGLIHPGSLLKDTPKSFGSYDPENFDGEFKGPLSAEEALNQSRNLPAVELVTKLKEKDFYEFLISAGVGIPKNREYYGHSIALGGFELSLLELAELYAVLPRSGLMNKAHLIHSEKVKKANLKRVLTKESSFLVLDMLSRGRMNTQLFSKLVKKNPVPVSWKTGTSSGFRDAWTIGTFGPYVLGVWIGNFAGQSNRSFIGREMAAPLFFEIYDTVRWSRKMDDQALLSWIKPESVKLVRICPLSGKLPGEHCQHTSEVHFIPGTSPIAKCDIHRQIWISKRTNMLSCHPDPKHDKAIVHEYWPSDLLEVFAKAGFPRKAPPRAGNNCDKMDLASIGQMGMSPEILSPKKDTVYNLRSQVLAQNSIPLHANFDSSAKELFWFVDDEYVGKAAMNEPLFWKARDGQFIVKAIDNLGRSSSRKVQVKHVD